MKLFKKLLKWLSGPKAISKLSVWTVDKQGKTFHYDIAIFKLRRAGVFFVKFKRFSLATSNQMTWHRVLNSAEVNELQYQAQ